MVTVKISDQSKPLHEVSLDWLTSTISKNRIMDKENAVEININSGKVKLDLFANCAMAGEAKASNEIESRIVFLWDELVLSKHGLDPNAIYDFLRRMDRWVSFVPKE